MSIEKMLTLAENYIGIFYFTFFMKSQDILKKLKCYSKVFQFCQLTIFQQTHFQSKIVNLLFFSDPFVTTSQLLLTPSSGSFWAHCKDHLPASNFQLIGSFSSCTLQQRQERKQDPPTPPSISPDHLSGPCFAKAFVDRQRWPDTSDRLFSSAITETTLLVVIFFVGFFLALFCCCCCCFLVFFFQSTNMDLSGWAYVPQIK